MASPTEEDLDGINNEIAYSDGTVVRVFIMRTTDPAYPSGWAYKLHYGAKTPNPPQTLPDGTIRRYDNAHEKTKGHELHSPPDSTPEKIQFPGMAVLWDRFWCEIPKVEIDV